jgi:hypothetical protein
LWVHYPSLVPIRVNINFETIIFSSLTKKQNYGFKYISSSVKMPCIFSESESKVKPIDVKIIEHEDFIDYEIEFADLSDEKHARDGTLKTLQ